MAITEAARQEVLRLVVDENMTARQVAKTLAISYKNCCEVIISLAKETGEMLTKDRDALRFLEYESLMQDRRTLKSMTCLAAMSKAPGFDDDEAGRQESLLVTEDVIVKAVRANVAISDRVAKLYALDINPDHDIKNQEVGSVMIKPMAAIAYLEEIRKHPALEDDESYGGPIQ